MHTFENQQQPCADNAACALPQLQQPPQPQAPQKPAATATDASDATQAARHCITRARAALVMEHPFFGSLALRLRLKTDPTCADMWTDGKTLGYNPAFSTALTQKSLVGAMAHEVLHLAFGHHLRRKGRDAKLWNRACDLAINHILVESGFTLPQGFAHNPAYAGMNADEIFDAQVTCFCARTRLVIAYASWDVSWESNSYAAIPDNSGDNMHQGKRKVTKRSH